MLSAGVGHWLSCASGRPVRHQTPEPPSRRAPRVAAAVFLTFGNDPVHGRCNGKPARVLAREIGACAVKIAGAPDRVCSWPGHRGFRQPAGASAGGGSGCVACRGSSSPTVPAAVPGPGTAATSASPSPGGAYPRCRPASPSCRRRGSDHARQRGAPRARGASARRGEHGTKVAAVRDDASAYPDSTSAACRSGRAGVRTVRRVSVPARRRNAGTVRAWDCL